ncbi:MULTISPECIES: GntR family transcriptional regulator [unclassified Streptomyces]|uniref:GntR family transcriptional regulator n=1 Tax=unclassified Streptomyces TaxID=2593676 RepID=UPI0004BFB9DB|nr:MULTISPECIES: GntR family transcriptional regulator [unclassified Streptomyces]
MEQAASRRRTADSLGSTESRPPEPRAAARARAAGSGLVRPVSEGPAGGPAEGAARGEHTHGESPIPLPRRSVVRRSSVRGQVLDALRAALVGGELAPGEVYSAPVLGERFGVSATPVREAMQQLALEGAIEVVPNRGFRVVERCDRELDELAEIRALLEVPVVLRLARTVPAGRWAELRPLAEATVRVASGGDVAGYAEADRAFHRAVLGLTGNEQLVRLADDLQRRAQWPVARRGGAGAGARHGRASLVADAAEHTALLDALIAQDAGVVGALVADHFGTAGSM